MNAEVKPAKHSAAGPYLGFALQPVRAFHHLLTSPRGSSVSLEFQDDVAVHYPKLRLEQTKSALKQIGPVTFDVYEGGAHDFFLRSGTRNAGTAHQSAVDFVASNLSR